METEHCQYRQPSVPHNKPHETLLDIAAQLSRTELGSLQQTNRLYRDIIAKGFTEWPVVCVEQLNVFCHPNYVPTYTFCSDKRSDVLAKCNNKEVFIHRMKHCIVKEAHFNFAGTERDAELVEVLASVKSSWANGTVYTPYNLRHVSWDVIRLSFDEVFRAKNLYMERLSVTNMPTPSVFPFECVRSCQNLRANCQTSEPKDVADWLHSTSAWNEPKTLKFKAMYNGAVQLLALLSKSFDDANEPHAYRVEIPAYLIRGEDERRYNKLNEFLLIEYEMRVKGIIIVERKPAGNRSRATPPCPCKL